MRVAIFNAATRIFDRFADVAAADLQHNVAAGEAAHETPADLASLAPGKTYMLGADGEPVWAPQDAPAPVRTLDQAKRAKAGDVAQAFDARIATGLAYGGLHVQIDDGSRGNLQSLVTMATLVGQGLTTWPTNFARGWVTSENERIPLPTPQDGVTLALAASAYYSALVQHEADIALAVTAAADQAALAAIDVTAGWPAP